MTNATEWSGPVGRNWADEWQRTDRSFSQLTARLLTRIAALPGERILDVGCGAGELALSIGRTRLVAHVLGVDISVDLLETARSRAERHANTTFAVADASTWSDPDFQPDLLVSRHGVMFFDNPVHAFRNLARGSNPGARLLFSCFGPTTENRWASEPIEAIASDDLKPEADRQAPGPFAFADPLRVQSILQNAGWTDVVIQPDRFAYIAGEGDDPVADAMTFLSRIGPAAPRLRALPENKRAKAEASLRALLERRRVNNRVCFDAMAWIVSARSCRD